MEILTFFTSLNVRRISLYDFTCLLTRPGRTRKSTGCPVSRRDSDLPNDVGSEPWVSGLCTFLPFVHGLGCSESLLKSDETYTLETLDQFEGLSGIPHCP